MHISILVYLQILRFLTQINNYNDYTLKGTGHISKNLVQEIKQQQKKMNPRAIVENTEEEEEKVQVSILKFTHSTRTNTYPHITLSLT